MGRWSISPRGAGALLAGVWQTGRWRLTERFTALARSEVEVVSWLNAELTKANATGAITPLAHSCVDTSGRHTCFRSDDLPDTLWRTVSEIDI